MANDRASSSSFQSLPSAAVDVERGLSPSLSAPRSSVQSDSGDYGTNRAYRDRTMSFVHGMSRAPTRRRKSSGVLLGFSPELVVEHLSRRPSRKTQTVAAQAIEEAISTGTLKVDHLTEKGLSMEELATAVYEVLLEQDLPNFLEKINIHQDGGLDRVQVLWYPEKFFWFFCLLGCISFNVAFLLGMNWSIFQSYILLGVAETLQKSQSHDLAGSGLSKLEEAEARAINADIFAHISDPTTRTMTVTAAAAVATFEVLWILSYIFSVLRHMFIFTCDSNEYRCYMAVLQVVQHTLPTLSTFSSIKLFARVHPSLIYQEYFEHLQESWCRGTPAMQLASTGYFVMTRLLCAVTALSAFAVKLLAVGLKLVNPHYGIVIRVASVVALLNQSMGCVMFEQVLQNRVFLFVFGGSDTEYRDDELALRNVYQCRVAKQIWMLYWNAGERFKAIVSLTTLDHYDLQRLLVEDLDMETTEECEEDEEDRVDPSSTQTRMRNSIIVSPSSPKDRSRSSPKHQNQELNLRMGDPVARKSSNSRELIVVSSDERNVVNIDEEIERAPPANSFSSRDRLCPRTQ